LGSFTSAPERILLSPDVLDPAKDDTSQAEIFARFNMTDRLHLTVSMQRLRNSRFFAATSDPRHTGRIAGLRLHYGF
jgi:hypothetical protein